MGKAKSKGEALVAQTKRRRSEKAKVAKAAVKKSKK